MTRLVRSFALSLLAGAFLAPALASAATQTATFNVTATVPQTCKIAAQNLAFPNFDSVTNADVTASANLTVTCTKPGTVAGTTATWTVALDGGKNPVSGQRQMMDQSGAGTNAIAYDLYTDAAATSSPWAPNATVPAVANASALSPATITVYGRIAASKNTDAVVGSYKDVVTATVNF